MRIVSEAQLIPAGGTSSSTRYSLIVKFLSGNEVEQTISKFFGAPRRELLTLSQVLSAFNAFQKERGGDKYCINAPEHVYGVCEVSEYVLVMQDLREAGYVLHMLYIVMRWAGTRAHSCGQQR